MKTKGEESINEFDLDSVNDLNDEDLQEAFAAGVIKPGLNILCEEKTYKNNVKGLLDKLKEFNLNLNWLERLDLINTLAPMPPEAYEEASDSNKSNVVKLKNHFKFNSSLSKYAMDDFKREMLFHRQAQSAVLIGIPKLKSLGILTKRPDDYLAEMAKSDSHMHKVRQNLAARQAAANRSEKIKELRRLKKIGKQTQIENKMRQANEKRKMLNEVKKYKKGLSKDLSFLDNKVDKKEKKAKLLNKRALRNEKFGFGGKKRGSKKNTKESASFMGKINKKGKKLNTKNKRLGKSRRIKKRSKK